MRVLCVEDNVDVASLLFEALTDAGYLVDLAYTGEEALAAVATSRPDVILLDITLPDIDGITLCARFREEQDIPVIMVTARHTTDDMAAGFEHGADDYVTKPFNMQILLRRLEAVTRYREEPSDPQPEESLPHTAARPVPALPPRAPSPRAHRRPRCLAPRSPPASSAPWTPYPANASGSLPSRTPGHVRQDPHVPSGAA